MAEGIYRAVTGDWNGFSAKAQYRTVEELMFALPILTLNPLLRKSTFIAAPLSPDVELGTRSSTQGLYGALVLS